MKRSGEPQPGRRVPNNERERALMAPGGLLGTIRHCSCLIAGRAGRFLDSRRFAIYATCDSLTHVRAGDAAIPRRPKKRRARPAVLVQYGALPYRFTPMAALEILIVTTRQSRRWIVPKGWPIKRLTPSKSAPASLRASRREGGDRRKVDRQFQIQKDGE